MPAEAPTRHVLDRLVTRRTIVVVAALHEGGTMRFSELERHIGAMSQKVLTQTLRALERDGIVDRHVSATVPVAVRYSLTPLGDGLADAMGAVREWASANLDAIHAARDEYASQHP